MKQFVIGPEELDGNHMGGPSAVVTQRGFAHQGPDEALKSGSAYGTRGARRAVMKEFHNPSIKQNVGKLVDQGHETVDGIKSQMTSVRSQLSDSTSSLGTYVKANPLKAIGIAFGLGYVAMRVRTSPIIELAFLGLVGYGVTKLVGNRSADPDTLVR